MELYSVYLSNPEELVHFISMYDIQNLLNEPNKIDQFNV